MRRVWDVQAVFAIDSPAILFGVGTVTRVGERAGVYGATKALIIADRNVARSGHAAKVEASLAAASVASEVFDGVESEPSNVLVREVVAFAQDKGFDLVVAIGGGSAIDLAKAVNVVLTNGGDPDEYIDAARPAPNPVLPFIAIPTTAGTAAEISAGAVISVPERNTKENFGRRGWRLATAICDPELTLTVPPKVTAYSGVDALGHAVDSYTNVHFNPICDVIDMQVISMITENLPVAVAKGNNLAARSAVMFAASSAGLGFSQRGTALTHGISHPLGVYGHLPHGLTISLMLPFVMEFNIPACTPKLADIAEAMGQDIRGLTMREAAYKAVAAVHDLNRDVGLPSRLRDVGVDEDLLPKIASETLTQRKANVDINARDASEAQILALLKEAY